MEPISRRRFLIQGGASIAGGMLSSSLAEHILAAPRTGAASVPVAEFPGRLVDDLATIVADLTHKSPYASALFTSQGGISISQDRNGKRVSEFGFPSRGVSIRVFDGSAFHESATASTSPDALRRAAQALQGDVTRAKDRY